MLTKFRKKMRAFTTVEILVAVGLVAILMVVAVPRLLDSRQTVSDSSAKQQLNTVMLSVNNWFAERDSYTDLTVQILQGRVPNVELVDAGDPTGKGTEGRALKVGVDIQTAVPQKVVLAASNGEENCWAIELSTTGTRYGYVKDATCDTGSTFDWQQFEFPNTAD